MDFKIAASSGLANGLTAQQINSMIVAFGRIRELESNLEDIDETITIIHQAIASNIAKNEENEEEIKNIYEPRLLHYAKLYETKVTKS